MKNTYLMGGIIVVVVLLVGAWYVTSTHMQKQAAQTSAALANPASTYCVNGLGGQVSLAEEGGGQVGYCHLPDGRVCEEWALFNNKTCSAPGPTASVSASSTLPLPSMANIHPR